MLSVKDPRRSRSKSPGGRGGDRDRSVSRSRDPPKSDDRYDERKPSKKYYDSDAGSVSDASVRPRKPKGSSKYAYDEAEERKPTSKSKSKYSESETDSDASDARPSHAIAKKAPSKYDDYSDDGRYGKSNGTKPKSKYDYSASEDDRPKERTKTSYKYNVSGSDSEPAKKDKKGASRGKYDDSASDADYRKPKSSARMYDDSGSEVEKRKPKLNPKYDAPQDEHDYAAKPFSKSKKYYESDSSDLPKHKPGEPATNGKTKHREYDAGSHPSYANPDKHAYGQPGSTQGYPQTRHMSYAPPQDDRYGRDPSRRHDDKYDDMPEIKPTSSRQMPGGFEDDHKATADPRRSKSVSSPSSGNYAQPQQYQYAQIDPAIMYKSKNDRDYVAKPPPKASYSTNIRDPRYAETKSSSRKDEKDDRDYYEAKPRTRDVKEDRYSKYSEPKSKRDDRDDKYSRYSEVKPSRKDDKDDRRPSRDDTKDLRKGLSPLAVGGTLAVGGLTVAGASRGGGGAKPPASPLLEAYKGTYQTISPMPSPMALATKKHDEDSDLSDLDLSDRESGKKKLMSTTGDDYDTVEIKPKSISAITGRPKKIVAFYDPSTDAKKIAAALQGTHRAPDVKPLIQILPHLSTEDILALRTEYKEHAKAQGKGINIAKHIKLRVPGNLGKATYATALGQWESEAYWANSYYQSGASRRELLIESLMGRSNSDIREIKNCFKDKRYDDDLEKCMKAELKADKFRVAILLALEERRMTEKMPLQLPLVRDDVKDLYGALTGREGGETAMIHIIVVRSDNHLREVMRVFERTYQRNFAREMITKSKNLVVSYIQI